MLSLNGAEGVSVHLSWRGCLFKGVLAKSLNVFSCRVGCGAFFSKCKNRGRHISESLKWQSVVRIT